jgi:hypothetical protein
MQKLRDTIIVVLTLPFTVRFGLGQGSNPDPDPNPPGVNEKPLQAIGKGSFGIIFNVRGGCWSVGSQNKKCVLKRTVSKGVDENYWLVNDALWHKRIEGVFKRCDGELKEMVLPDVPGFEGCFPTREMLGGGRCMRVGS